MTSSFIVVSPISAYEVITSYLSIHSPPITRWCAIYLLFPSPRAPPFSVQSNACIFMVSEPHFTNHTPSHVSHVTSYSPITPTPISPTSSLSHQSHYCLFLGRHHFPTNHMLPPQFSGPNTKTSFWGSHSTSPPIWCMQNPSLIPKCNQSFESPISSQHHRLLLYKLQSIQKWRFRYN